MKTIIHILILTLAVLGATKVVPGIVVSSFLTALIVGIVLVFVNAIIKPILTILTLPITILTLGLFSVILNALLFWGISIFVSGFHIDDFKSALIGSIIVSIISSVLGFIFRE